MASNTVSSFMSTLDHIGYSFEQLANFIRKTNQQYKKPVVLASYVNKEKADGKIITMAWLNDAAAYFVTQWRWLMVPVIWNSVNTIANEYFPNHTLKLSDETQRKLRMSYMDNFVAYLMILNGKWVDDEEITPSSTHSLSTTF